MAAENKESPPQSLLNRDTNPSNVIPTKFTLDSRIRFRCHPEVSCFTKCCSNIRIILSPFDILRLKKRLGMTASEFLHLHTEPTLIEKSDLPGVTIRLDDSLRCPFVRENGCSVYSDRPTACRYYPVGMANFHEAGGEGRQSEEFYFLIKEPHCKGFDEDKEWTIREWRADQGVDLADEMNKGWMELVMRRKSFSQQATMSEPAKRMFFMASNDLDHFRSFVLESTFLEKYDVPPETLEEIRDDDLALLRFAFDYLSSALFGTDRVRLKKDVLDRLVQGQEKKSEEDRKNVEERAAAEYEEIKRERERLEKEG